MRTKKSEERSGNWIEFLSKAIELLRLNKKPFYVKKDLRESANSVKLYGNEVLQDEFNLMNTFYSFEC